MPAASPLGSFTLVIGCAPPIAEAVDEDAEAVVLIIAGDVVEGLEEATKTENDDSVQEFGTQG